MLGELLSVDDYGLEALVHPRDRPIGGFDVGRGYVVTPFTPEELTDFYKQIRGGATNVFDMRTRYGTETPLGEHKWLSKTPCTLEEVEREAVWYVLRQIGLTDPHIAKLAPEERLWRFRTEIEKNPDNYAFARQRKVAIALLALAQSEELRD